MTTDQVYVVVEMFDGVLDNLEVYTNDPDPHELYPATCDEFWNRGKKVFVTPCITRTKSVTETSQPYCKQHEDACWLDQQ